jgi:uncharacterized protein
MITKKDLQSIERRAQAFFEDANGCHDWTHVERVRVLALKIGQKEGADLAVIEAAALLHDIARKEEMEQRGRICHAERGKELAREILVDYPQITSKERENVLHCILAHRSRTSEKPETIEAQCLSDADKLDALGAVGVARDFLFAGNAGSKKLYTGREQEVLASGQDHAFSEEDSAFLEYEFKLKHLHKKLFTQEGKRIARERQRYMGEFFERFWKEVEGRC